MLSARKAYHRTADAATNLLGGECFESDEIFEKVRFIDFYRYCSVTLDEMLNYLDTKVPWIRPSDTGRSTNCLINDIGIYVHKAERGHHNYSVPYSWDVRLGHKQRDAALAELDDDIDEQHVMQVLDQVGYKIKTPQDTQQLAIYYTSTDSLDDTTLQQWLQQRLPAGMLPTHLVALPALPLSANGKVLKSALPPITSQATDLTEYVAPSTPIEQTLARVWAEGLQISRIGVRDNFFELGADSLLAIRIVTRLHEAGVQVEPVDIFEHQTIEALSQVARADQGDIASQPLQNAAPFSQVLPDQLDKLSGLLGRN